MKKIYLIIMLSLIFIFKGKINAQCPVSIQVIESSGIASNDAIVCNGDQATLIASGGVTFLWSTGATVTSSFITVTPNTTTTYTVTITDTLSVACSASVQITVNPLPIVSAGNVSGCAGTPIVLSGSPTGGTFSVPNPFTGSSTTYTYSYNDVNGCSDTSTSANITVNALPIASITETDNSGAADDDNIICSGDNATLDATHPSGTAYLWSNGSTSATIAVSPALDSTYTVTVTSADGCSATSSLLIMVNSLPSAQIFEFDNSGTTANDSIICNGSFVTLTACCGASYLWSNGITTATISDSPASNTTYTVSVTSADECISSATVLITVNALPNAVIAETDNSGTTNNDGIIILGSNATLTASGGIAYLWSNGITAAANTVSPGPAGTYAYTVTVTNTNGCSATASSTITVLSSSAASITETDNSGSTPNDGIICEEQSATLTAAALNDSLFLWSNGSSTSAITVSPLSTTTYTVTITDNNNATSTASLQITVKSLPIDSIIETDNSGVAPNDGIIIAGFNATLTATGGGTYLWSNGTTTAATIVTPAITATYTVTVTSADGCSTTASIQITVLDSSTASIQETDNSGATNDNIICFGDSATLTVFALDSNLFLWSNGATTVSINVSPATTTTYVVTVTNNNGATSTDSIPITVNQLPIVSIAVTDSVVICIGDSVTLTASMDTNSTDSIYFWSSDDTTAIIKVSPAADTICTVTVINTNGCSSTTSVQITVNPLPIISIVETDNSGVAPNDSIIIEGFNAILTATGGGTYSWSNGVTTAVDTVYPIADSTFIVTVTSIDGCSSTDTIKITVLPAPSASITITENSGSSSTDSTICLGDGATLKASLGSGSTASSYLWSNGATIDSIIVYPTADTTFTVIVTDINGATSTASIPITMKPLPIVSINVTDNSGLSTIDSVICKGGSVTLIASDGGGTGSTFLWGDSITTDTIILSPAIDTICAVTVTNTNGCASTASVPITVNPPPIVSIIETDNSGSSQNDSIICKGDSAILTTSGGLHYLWNDTDSSTTATITVSPTTDTTFTVTVWSADSCSSTASKKIIVKDLPIPLINVNDSIICYGESADLTASDNNDTMRTFLWSNGATTAKISVADTISITYTVTVFNSDGCTKTASKLITVKPKLNGTIIGNDTVCQNDTPPEVTFQGYYGAPPYTFTYIISGDTNIYTRETSDSTPTVTISNPTLVAGSFTYILISVLDSNSCSQDILSSADSSSTTVLVNPAPVKPDIISLVNDKDSICAGSTNINFYVSNPEPGVKYNWDVAGDASLRDSTDANTVISFGSSLGSQIIIGVTATNSITSCSNEDTMTVFIKNSTDAIEERKIILKQPGNLLVYPDNSMAVDSGYQWGYDLIDTIIGTHAILGSPHDIPGQVYQFFIPADTFLIPPNPPNQLDTNKFCFWVLLKSGECQSKVYYNGPYKYNPRPLPIAVDSTVALTVFPNPTTGDMNILLQGKIYGNIDAKIYNALGQVVYKKRFEKKQNTTTQNIKLNSIPEGVYMLELLSSDHQKLTTRIIVYH